MLLKLYFAVYFGKLQRANDTLEMVVGKKRGYRD